jgi:hypothetical protein
LGDAHGKRLWAKVAILRYLNRRDSFSKSKMPQRASKDSMINTASEG